MAAPGDGAGEQGVPAFKEWALVCEDLGAGRHSLILRKGGIAEGKGGFRFQHDEFYLFPTLFHEQVQRLDLPPDTPLPPAVAGGVAIRLLARLEWVRVVTDLDRALALAPFHIWREEVVRERFGYGKEEGLHVAFVRVFRLAEPWLLADDPRYGGCRSWVTLPPPAAVRGDLLPSLPDEESARRSAEILAVLG
jgi:hypothetical protein